MNEREIEKLISAGESQMLDFKEEISDGFYKNISAFSNTKGGIILLGVSDKGKIMGVSPTREFMESFINRIIDKLTIYPEIEALDIEGKRLIAVTVARSSFPVSYEGRYYERVGNTTREMRQERLRALLLKGKPWDLLTNNFSYEEIDIEAVKRFMRIAVEKNRLPKVSLEEQPWTILEKLGLIIDGKLTNGAILIFGRDPQKHFVNLCVRIGRLKTETTIIDDKWARGNLFYQYEEAINILKQLISVRYEIKDWHREDIWDYPIPALREAVLNALIHRDYFNIGNFIQIKVYDDHIWFFNLGGLPEGISIDQLKLPHGSVLRNSLIAKAFYLAGEIEQYGSGTVRMVEWMKEAGLPEPEYKEEMGGFSVYFYKDVYTQENLRKMGLNERQIKAVLYVKKENKITNREYMAIFSISKASATRDLTDLVERNIFGISGTGKRDIHYILLKRQK